MVARVVQEWGRVDVLVANAGGGRRRPMDTKASSLDSALLQLVVDMNLFGTVYSCRAVRSHHQSPWRDSDREDHADDHSGEQPEQSRSGRVS
jgi:NAD(P)-dependent dehydrogenase (short-subunit alcohol dehydrogenase family)